MEQLFPLIDRQSIADGTMTFFFSTEGSDYQFKAGQHTDYTLVDPPYTDAEGNTRTFSFCNLPGENKIQIATRMRDTAFKNSLKELPLGTKVKVKAPMGRFTLHADPAKPAVFLIGGIGITPVLSIIRQWQKTNEQRDIFLFYANKNIESAAFHQELELVAKENIGFHFIATFTDLPPPNWTGETGRVDEKMIKKYLGNPQEAVFYASGPPAMVSAMVNLVEGLHVPEEQIKTEDFAGY